MAEARPQRQRYRKPPQLQLRQAESGRFRPGPRPDHQRRRHAARHDIADGRRPQGHHRLRQPQRLHSRQPVPARLPYDTFPAECSQSVPPRRNGPAERHPQRRARHNRRDDSSGAQRQPELRQHHSRRRDARHSPALRLHPRYRWKTAWCASTISQSTE